MTEKISITPDEPLTGTAISVALDLLPTSVAPKFLVVRKIDGKNPNSFQIDLHPFNASRLVGQFALYEAGTYQLEIGTQKLPLLVRPARAIPFFIEMSLLTLSVGLILGGVILWSKRKRNLAPKVGSF